MQTGRHQYNIYTYNYISIYVIYTGRATTPGNLSTGQMHSTYISIQHLLYNIIILEVSIYSSSASPRTA